MAGFQQGDVIRVEGWPGTSGRRFVVEEVVKVPTSEFPLQVYCWETRRSRVSVLRVFPADRCRLEARGRRTAVLLAAVLAFMAIFAIAYPAVARAVPLERAKPICSVDWRRGVQQRERLIRCAVRHWPVPGGWRKALEVARCESYPELRPRTRNGVHVGIFQLSGIYYPSWYERFGRDLQLPRARTNARTNVIVAVRMANAWGWAAWSCA